jgi:putative ABC transport system substrate-binding protein
MRRRELIILLGGAAAAWPVALRAQQKAMPVIGLLSPATTQSYQQTGPGYPGPELMRASLAKQGLVDGENIRLEVRLAEGKLDRLPELAEALVREGARVILAFGEAAARAAQAATHTIPIVCGGDDLVNSGLAASLAKPGSNVTGVSMLATELDAKKIEVLKELLPKAKYFGVLNDPTTAGLGRVRAMTETARSLGVALQVIDVHGADDIATAFKALQAGGAEGVNVASSPLLAGLRERVGEASLQVKIPAVCQWRYMVEVGCLASYGTTPDHFYALEAQQAARLLRGAKPEELPVQQPTKFELVINLKTAQALGLTVPQALLLRADEVIE